MNPRAGQITALPDLPVSKPLRVLIAHQSTIPHYRVRFYELLEQMRPPDWTFEVVYDPEERSKRGLYKEPVDHLDFNFPMYHTPSRILQVGKKRLVWQNFLPTLAKADILVTDTHLANLSYPVAAAVTRVSGKLWVPWGHVGDRNQVTWGGAKRLAESLKREYIRASDAFFAYTSGEGERLVSLGYDASRITVLNNTIDIEREREHFLSIRGQRSAHRDEFHLSKRKVLLHVGRLIPGKRIDWMAEMFRRLYAADPAYHLVVVGSGTEAGAITSLQAELGTDAVTYPGAITERSELGKWFNASDLFIMPGHVGLAPLQAICYDLPVLYFNLPGHGPEVEYLNGANSVCLSGKLLPGEAAAMILQSAEEIRQRPKTDAYASIEHLTLKGMAERFITGINKFSKLRQKHA